MEELTINRRFSAPIERVFEAWTQANVLAKWFGPEGFSVVNATSKLEVGGSYAIEIESPEGVRIRHFGTYVDVLKPERLVFTWMLQNQACEGSAGLCAETLVSIHLKQIGNETELSLSHEQLPNKEAYDGHKFGWDSSFASLENLFSND